MRVSIFCFLSVLGSTLSAQLFDSPRNQAMVRRGVDFVYNLERDSARHYIDKVKRALPNHPVGPMMESTLILWNSIPFVTADTTFERFTNKLNEVIRLAMRLDGGRQEDPEAIFFELAARGLLAEYYAESGSYMKAASEANKTYNLLKLGSKLVDQYPEFYLTTGVYNYFREKYPERYPVYKPFVWFFRSGDIELGLKQLETACEKAILTRVEAHIYLSYIYLRYEYQPDKAIDYLGNMMRMYPNNRYAKAKYLEALTSSSHLSYAQKNEIFDLINDPMPYFKLAGYSYLGYLQEKADVKPAEAKKTYLKALSYLDGVGDKGEYYISLTHLGLARIYRSEKQYDLAIKHGNLSLEYAETPEIISEAKVLVDALGG